MQKVVKKKQTGNNKKEHACSHHNQVIVYNYHNMVQTTGILYSIEEKKI